MSPRFLNLVIAMVLGGIFSGFLRAVWTPGEPTMSLTAWAWRLGGFAIGFVMFVGLESARRRANRRSGKVK